MHGNDERISLARTMSGRLSQVVVTGARFGSLAPERQILEGVAEVREASPRGRQELLAATQDADAILNQTCSLDAEVIAALARCRVIVQYGVGADSIDIEAATRRSIQVCHVPDYCTEEVTAHTWALLLGFERKIPQMLNRLRAGHWDIVPTHQIHRLAGRTLGLLGFGRIARRVAAVGAAFGMRLLAHDPFVEPVPMAAAGAESTALDHLMARSDYVSIHVPLTPATRGLVGAELLALVCPGAVLVNTSRGKVVREDALIAALREGRLRGAALDVFEDEPLPPAHPFREMDNVVLSPHVGWYSVEAREEVRRRAAEEVRSVLLGEPPRHPVNRPGGAPGSGGAGRAAVEDAARRAPRADSAREEHPRDAV